MPLSTEAIIAIVGLGVALPPALAILWRSRKARQSAAAGHHASSDPEMQLAPNNAVEMSESPPLVVALPAATRMLLNVPTESRLYEQSRVAFISVYQEITSRLS